MLHESAPVLIHVGTLVLRFTLLESDLTQGTLRGLFCTATFKSHFAEVVRFCLAVEVTFYQLALWIKSTWCYSVSLIAVCGCTCEYILLLQTSVPGSALVWLGVTSGFCGSGVSWKSENSIGLLGGEKKNSAQLFKSRNTQLKQKLFFLKPPKHDQSHRTIGRLWLSG